ncbi:MAG: hypothetical protein QG654_471 [Patescibacteria group bacterium]|jgi:hypothetical protein|nr:hypothetical protein [Patescibacteria group bacterium]
MKICRVRLAEAVGPVLTHHGRALNIPIVNECDNVRVNFSRFGRVLRHVEVGRDFTELLAHGIEIGIPQEGNFSISTGRFEMNETGDVYNCIIVSFDIGREFALYQIHHAKEPSLYRIYNAIRDVSMSGPREEVSA